MRGVPRALGELHRGGHFASSYATEWRAFAAAVARREPVPASFEDGRQALAISLAATQSASSGAPVRVDDVLAAAG
jgi:predicted dehydrogenase